MWAIVVRNGHRFVRLSKQLDKPVKLCVDQASGATLTLFRLWTQNRTQKLMQMRCLTPVEIMGWCGLESRCDHQEFYQSVSKNLLAFPVSGNTRSPQHSPQPARWISIEVLKCFDPISLIIGVTIHFWVFLGGIHLMLENKTNCGFKKHPDIQYGDLRQCRLKLKKVWNLNKLWCIVQIGRPVFHQNQKWCHMIERFAAYEPF